MKCAIDNQRLGKAAFAILNFVTPSEAGRGIAAWYVGKIGLLYAVEKKLREQTAGPQLRAAMRVWQSRPVLARLHRQIELVRGRLYRKGGSDNPRS